MDKKDYQRHLWNDKRAFFNRNVTLFYLIWEYQNDVKVALLVNDIKKQAFDLFESSIIDLGFVIDDKVNGIKVDKPLMMITLSKNDGIISV